jgi:Bax protein
LQAYSNPKKVLIFIAAAFVIVFLISVYIFNQEQAPIVEKAPLKTQTTEITVNEKKAQFESLIVPAVNKVYTDLMDQYESVKATLEAGQSSSKIQDLKLEYKVSTDKELLMALKPHPKSIAIAQAAMESSWATSRFFEEAYNIFGVWSFDENEPRIAAQQQREGKTIWVRKYASVEEAVYDYYLTLARGSAFQEFRETKMETSDPFILVTKLDRYSEKGELYGEELTSIIKFNKFEQYDLQ